MTKYAETVNQDTPRLVVEFASDGRGNEQYKWGMVGKMPALALLGYIVRVQAELAFRAAEECPESALVISWDAEAQKFSWFINPTVPVDPVVGMLEVVKAFLTGQTRAQMQGNQSGLQGNQSGLLGPDGRPFLKLG